MVRPIIIMCIESQPAIVARAVAYRAARFVCSFETYRGYEQTQIEMAAWVHP